METLLKLINIAYFFSEPLGIYLFCVCPLQEEETQNQSSNGSASHQSNGLSAAATKGADNILNASSSKDITLTFTDVLGNETGLRTNDQNTGLRIRNSQTSSVVRTTTRSGHPSNLALHLGNFNEEKQDQSKDEPPLRQQEVCECKFFKNIL